MKISVNATVKFSVDGVGKEASIAVDATMPDGTLVSQDSTNAIAVLNAACDALARNLMAKE